MGCASHALRARNPCSSENGIAESDCPVQAESRREHDPGGGGVCHRDSAVHHDADEVGAHLVSPEPWSAVRAGRRVSADLDEMVGACRNGQAPTAPPRNDR